MIIFEFCYEVYYLIGPFYLQGLCSIKISEADIQTLSPPEIWEKYERFHQMNENPNMRFIYIYICYYWWFGRDCPSCGEMNQGDPSNPKMICQSCNHHFCFFHANQHSPDESCWFLFDWFWFWSHIRSYSIDDLLSIFGLVFGFC